MSAMILLIKITMDKQDPPLTLMSRSVAATIAATGLAARKSSRFVSKPKAGCSLCCICCTLSEVSPSAADTRRCKPGPRSSNVLYP
jgi:hypothetical protein